MLCVVQTFGRKMKLYQEHIFAYFCEVTTTQRGEHREQQNPFLKPEILTISNLCNFSVMEVMKCPGALHFIWFVIILDLVALG